MCNSTSPYYPPANLKAGKVKASNHLHRTPEDLKQMQDYLTNSLVSQPKWFVHPAGSINIPQVKEEGKTPMRYETNTCIAPSAYASISVPSDDQKKIDYLNSRAQSIFNKIDRDFSDMFHLNGPSHPRYYKELIDAIKNGEYTINEKTAANADESWEYAQDEDHYYDYDVFFGIDFTKFPKSDYKGYETAREELRTEFQKVKDIVAIKSADDALAAVQAFEDWKPSNAPTVQ